MSLILIYAVSENGIIGRDNTIPWRLSADLRRFKKLTSGHTIIMGRKTHESLRKALPKRRNIVISRNHSFQAEGCEVVHSLEQALAISATDSKCFLIGGASLFQESIDKGYAQFVYETLVHAEVEGDVSIQTLDESLWQLVEIDAQQADDKNEFAYTYRNWQRKA